LPRVLIIAHRRSADSEERGHQRNGKHNYNGR